MCIRDSVNIGFPGQKNDLLLLRLDLEGISISTGSACTAGIVQTSHVLEAFYGPDSHLSLIHIL